ncbi:uncharacterized protein LOC114273696 [Camellia sinensis]|uniref:uncharacterized protein LOC114273696 n=1 Tax=Camellia sinensis TaxID=4442 RepID=UPI001035C26B|nr:uncharacterized protein LOC114273696 [Camellia sinensis]
MRESFNKEEDWEIEKDCRDWSSRSGHRIRFWVDTWFGSHSLCLEFPRLYSLSVEKEVSLCTIVERKSQSEEWVFNFRRVLRAWEVEELGRLCARLDAENFHLSAEEDRLCWKPSPSGEFLVVSLYSRNAGGVSSNVPSLLWNNLASSKMQFFGWLAWKGRVKTVAYLQRIGVLGGSVCKLCKFCNSEVESANHVLLLCPAIWKVWSSLVDWWRLQWVAPGTIGGLLEWWAGFKFKKLEGAVWKSIPLTLLWSIWKCRNDFVFSGVHPQLDLLSGKSDIPSETGGLLCNRGAGFICFGRLLYWLDALLVLLRYYVGFGCCCLGISLGVAGCLANLMM